MTNHLHFAGVRLLSRPGRMRALVLALTLTGVAVAVGAGPAVAVDTPRPPPKAELATTSRHGPTGATPAAPIPRYSQVNCSRQGCTYLNATRSGSSVTVKAQGYNYPAYKKVWVQINVYVSETMTLMWSDRMQYTTNATGQTPQMQTWIDCGLFITVQAYTWLAYSNLQPEVDFNI